MRTLTALCGWLLCVVAIAQEVEDPEILLSIDVGFNTAYREGTWAPIDVTVDNTYADLEGWIEVTTIDGMSSVQSPLYRAPISSPLNSRKRVRLYAYLDDTSRIQAAIYDSNGQLAVDSPAYLEPRPIDDDDLIAVVIDDEPLDYGFLLQAVDRFEERRRLTRWNLSTAMLGLLPERQQCYDAIDVIVIGQIAVSRFTPEQRRMIEQYVHAGGTVAVMTGANASRIRGSWLEPLLGTTVEPGPTLDEIDVYARMLGVTSEDAPDRMASVASLVATGETRSTGAEMPFATRHLLGAGRVYTIAVDAPSHALQGVPRYHDLWREILGAAGDAHRANDFKQFDFAFINSLYEVSGVSIRPAEEVLLYLGLYILFGIVVNWVFWSRVGRREYAWVTLIFVSIAFTSYAVTSGTGGLGTQQMNHQVTVHQLGQNTGAARVHRVEGILSSRPTVFSPVLSTSSALAREAGLATVDNRWGMQQLAISRPFIFNQADQPSVDEFRVGYNEVRGYSESFFGTLGEGISGAVSLGPAGIETGTVRNDTGLQFERMYVFARGRFYLLEESEFENEYLIAQPDKDTNDTLGNFANYRGMYYFYGSNWQQFTDYLMVATTINEEFQAPDPYADPVFIGLVANQDPSATDVEGESRTIVTAPLTISTSLAGTDIVLLLFRDQQWVVRSVDRFTGENWLGWIKNRSEYLEYRPPENAKTDLSSAPLEIELHYTSSENVALRLRPTIFNGESASTENWVMETFEPSTDKPGLRRQRVLIPDWEALLNTQNKIAITLVKVDLGSGDEIHQRSTGLAAVEEVQYHVRARLLPDEATVENKEQLEWR